MLAWLPIIGPIIQGIVSIFSKAEDTTVALQKNTLDTQVAEAQVSATIIQATKDDIGLKISRDIICFPVAVWCALGTWDTIVAHHYPNLMFTVEKFPDTMAMIPYAVLVFLLGNIGINTWNRR